ncbi:MAG: hypothetical protein KatS3mg057_0885 [Herpetosiphonaceae bacterium]|nr:MAG: hypothetical protein KatS3mg057_0885 [Herpetosiphonaceae bacterium]
MAALLFLVLSFQYIPETLIDNPDGPKQVRLFGVITALAAALLLLRQHSLRRFVAFLMIYNTGVILSGVVSSPTGLTGALFETFNQLLFALLLFLSLALIERPELLAGRKGEGLLRRRPLTSAAFIGGALGLLGLPPFSGFASKALIYEGVAYSGWGYLAVLLAATMSCFYALARLLRDQFLGRGQVDVEDEDVLQRDVILPPALELDREPRLLAGVALALLLVGVVLGAYPQLLLRSIAEAVESLTFAHLL